MKGLAKLGFMVTNGGELFCGQRRCSTWGQSILLIPTLQMHPDRRECDHFRV
jgi:hypothetical protein